MTDFPINLNPTKAEMAQMKARLTGRDPALGEYRIEDRVEMHPATDAWMRGDRYGTVVKITHRFLHVHLDRSGRTVKTVPSSIFRKIIREG